VRVVLARNVWPSVEEEEGGGGRGGRVVCVIPARLGSQRSDLFVWGVKSEERVGAQRKGEIG
jgi:hypothetical protein